MSDWIDIKKEIPEDHTWLIVNCCKEGYNTVHYVRHYDNELFHHVIDSKIWLEVENVTHWQYMPEPIYNEKI
jgi:hypothetical protein